MTVFVSWTPSDFLISSIIFFISAMFEPESMTAMSYSPVISNIESIPLICLSLEESSDVGKLGLTETRLIALIRLYSEFRNNPKSSEICYSASHSSLGQVDHFSNVNEGLSPVFLQHRDYLFVNLIDLRYRLLSFFH